MLMIFKGFAKRVGTLGSRLQLRTKDPRLRELIAEARSAGMARMCRPAGPDEPGILSDGLEFVRLQPGDRDSLSELRVWLRRHGYVAKNETNTPKGRR